MSLFDFHLKRNDPIEKRCIYIWFLLRRVLIIEFKKTWKRVGALVFQIFNLIRIRVERCRLGSPGFGVQRTHPGFSKVVSRLAVVLVDAQLSATPLVDYIRYHRILETRDFVVHGNFDWPRFSVTRIRYYLYMCVYLHNKNNTHYYYTFINRSSYT